MASDPHDAVKISVYSFCFEGGVLPLLIGPGCFVHFDFLYDLLSEPFDEVEGE